MLLRVIRTRSSVAKRQHIPADHDIRETGPIQIGIVDSHREPDWPSAVPPGTRRYLAALAGDGPPRLVVNARGVRGEILRVGDGVLPVLVSDGAPGTASILSPIGHHVDYPAEEIGRRSRIGRRGWAALVWPLRLAFRAARLDRVALVNHWLLSGAPTPEVPPDAWPAVRDFLAERHPGHALVVPDIKPDLQPETFRALTEAGAIPVPTRRLHVVDPADPLPGQRLRKTRHRRASARRLVVEAAAREIPHEVAARQPERLAALYRQSNLERHSRLNPDYRPAFFAAALACERFRLRAWAPEGGDPARIASFNLQRLDDRMIHWSTFGAEPDADARSSAYQLAAASDLVLAEAEGLLLDWGAGAEEFKRFRGAKAYDQVEMVFVRHLPPHRRAAWHTLFRLREFRRRQLSPPAEAD